MKKAVIKASDIRKIRKKMEKILDHKRFEHTLGVAYTAAALAMCCQADTMKAQMAGLLHDCAKQLPGEKLIEICEKHEIPITDVERHSPYLLHAKAGSYFAKKKYNIQDQDILNAIRNHTTGRPGMSELEKIIYIADYIEPGRKQAPNLSQIRQLAFRDLDEALFHVLKDNLAYLQQTNIPMDPMTQETYDHYATLRERKEDRK